MSKISGFNIDPDKFEIQGSQFGGRDSTVSIQNPLVNVTRQNAVAVAKVLNENAKTVAKELKALRALSDMLKVDAETDTVTVDKVFIADLNKSIAAVKKAFDVMMKASKE
jgi:hypothetical protein